MSHKESVLFDRIMGIETEYGITYRHPHNRIIPDELARLMFRPIVEEYASSNIFHPNGSRLYLDVGAHPEWATAECRSISQLIAYEQAGDRVIDELARGVEKTGDNDGRVYVFKNNVDSVGNSYGCHENYLVSRDIPLKPLGVALVPFLITRQLIAGAGKIYRPYSGSPSEKYGPGFCLSQRADHVWEGVSSATTRSRPMINTRDEPHADSERFRRLHVIVGDSSVSEPTFALKVGSALLVLEMIEAGYPLPAITLANDVSAIRDIARDLSGKIQLPLADGGTITALDMQLAFYEAARNWLKDRPEVPQSTPLSEFERVVELWGRTLNAIDSGDYSAVDTEIDWIIKHTLINEYQQTHGYPIDHPRLAQIDLAYHDIRPGRGLGSVLSARGRMSRWITDEQIDHALHCAPDSTRAAIRGRFLAAAQRTGAPVTVDWMRLRVNRPEPHVVQLRDPFVTTDTDVDALIEYMDTHAHTYKGMP